MSFQSILEKYRQKAHSERDKGDRFERLMQGFLLTDPTYTPVLKEVWLWGEFPFRKDLGGQDTGIDLVARTHAGDYWAVQCKFVGEQAQVDKKALDSFLSTSSRTFVDEGGQTRGFAQRLWISTSARGWSSNANEAIQNQQIPVNRIGLAHLQQAQVDWHKLEKGVHGEQARERRRMPRPHQSLAIEKAIGHFKEADRGKLIMACGTGKTLTSLWIAEQQVGPRGKVLFLVPSIALLGQTLREWTANATNAIHPICICSDPKITKTRKQDEDSLLTSTVDLALPATTDIKAIHRELLRASQHDLAGMTVVFSTYQSIGVIAEAQAKFAASHPEAAAFDLIICDEAHRTTGITLAGDEESNFVRVHDPEYLLGRKRLYMTATPRLYSDDARNRAAEAEAVLCSMDDVALYGEEIHRIGFGEAVDKGLLSDYKVLVLTMSDADVPPAVQKALTSEQGEINTDDLSKLIGCINALSKQVLGDQGSITNDDSGPMRRAVAFCPSIKDSKRISTMLNSATSIYRKSVSEDLQSKLVRVDSQHIDGAMSAPERDGLMSWLKEDFSSMTCRVLTNVRCLSEGVDVPSLDAVLFLSPRNSQVDVVQSVGRVMRKVDGKEYGYIIIPVVVPSNVTPEEAMDNNERFKVVWTVLNALRAHDDRFNATVNKIDLNHKRPDNIQVVGVGIREQGSGGREQGEGGRDDDGGTTRTAHGSSDAAYRRASDRLGYQLTMQFEQLQNFIFARMVQKVGDKRYWEQWAKSVADIAERQIARIGRLVQEDKAHKAAFAAFLKGLQRNINPSITKEDAVEMLSQHIITKPVFDALFEGYSFVQNNPISQSMQSMLDLLEEGALQSDTETLERFYESVRMRAAGIDNADGKQRIIVELYDKFFRTAFPKMVERLGIVYTPVEVVDFIIHSVEDILRAEFGRSLADEHVQILDPFTGTGTFITRLLQSGIIPRDRLPYKYGHEIHANEIVLLAYYIAAVNIENAFHDAVEAEGYTHFEGICLTDTFQLGEQDGSEALLKDMFPRNSDRVKRQKKAPLRVIIGNPPYSVGQRSANDNAQNQSYPVLDGRIADTYARESNATLKNSLYDSYIKAIRWSTDRLDAQHGGIVCFVSNGSWIDGNAQDGLRKCLEREFSSIYVFNLRGNQRTSGELSRKEGGKIFGSGSRTPIAITLLVKKPKGKEEKAVIRYRDIGDYLSREDKLELIKGLHSMGNAGMDWQVLQPNAHGDWLNARSEGFGEFIPLGDKAAKSITQVFFLPNYSGGIKTNRDAWLVNFSSQAVLNNVRRLALNYEEQRISRNSDGEAETKIDHDPKKISWTAGLKDDFEANVPLDPAKGFLFDLNYRPFCKQAIFFHVLLVERPGLVRKSFLQGEKIVANVAIAVSVTSNGLSVLATNNPPDIHFNGDTQYFSLYTFEEQKENTPTLFDKGTEQKYIRRDGVSDWILGQARKAYGDRVTKEDIFYYVYGYLHDPQYRETYAADLKKMLPRLPLVDGPAEFWKYSKAGRTLAELHIGYETVPPNKDVRVVDAADGGLLRRTEEELYRHYQVEKMRFPKKDVKDTILYNGHIRIEGIPAKAYAYVVNGKSAIEWIMERYAITTHKESGIRNDPNDWAREHKKPRYILDLLLSVIEVSVRTVGVVEGLG